MCTVIEKCGTKTDFYISALIFTNDSNMESRKIDVFIGRHIHAVMFHAFGRRLRWILRGNSHVRIHVCRGNREKSITYY